MNEEQITPEEQEEINLAMGEFINAVRENYEQAAAHAELMTQAVLYLMRTNDMDTVEINEADAGTIVSQMELEDLHLHLHVEAPEDEAGLWTMTIRIAPGEDDEDDLDS